MDPIAYSPFPFPDFGGVFLPFRYWTIHASWPFLSVEQWASSPHVVGVA